MLWGGRSICNKCKKERYNMKKVIIIVISFGLISCSNIGQRKLKIGVMTGLFTWIHTPKTRKSPRRYWVMYMKAW